MITTQYTQSLLLDLIRFQANECRGPHVYNKDTKISKKTYVKEPINIIKQPNKYKS